MLLLSSVFYKSCFLWQINDDDDDDDVRQNDTNFTLLQEELNAPIFRPLRPNFAIGPL